MSSHVGALDVTVLDARCLRDTQTFGKQDPYVELSLKGSSYKSKTHVDGGVNPTWNERFEYKMDASKQFNPEIDTIHIKIMNANDLTRDDLIGEGQLPTRKAVIEGSDDLSVQLVYKNKAQGSIHFILRWTPVRSPGTQAPAPPPPRPAPPITQQQSMPAAQPPPPVAPQPTPPPPYPAPPLTHQQSMPAAQPPQTFPPQAQPVPPPTQYAQAPIFHGQPVPVAGHVPPYAPGPYGRTSSMPTNPYPGQTPTYPQPPQGTPYPHQQPNYTAAVPQAHMNQQPFVRDKEAEANRAFNNFDRDRSGFLDRAEFLQMLHFLGHTYISHENAYAIYATLDLNSNGQISREEFVQCYMLNF